MYCRNQQYQPWATPRTEVVLDAEMPLLQEAQAADPIAAILDRLMTVVSKLETCHDDTDRFLENFDHQSSHSLIRTHLLYNRRCRGGDGSHISHSRTPLSRANGIHPRRLTHHSRSRRGVQRVGTHPVTANNWGSCHTTNNHRDTTTKMKTSCLMAMAQPRLISKNPTDNHINLRPGICPDNKFRTDTISSPCFNCMISKTLIVLGLHRPHTSSHNIPCSDIPLVRIGLTGDNRSDFSSTISHRPTEFCVGNRF